MEAARARGETVDLSDALALVQQWLLRRIQTGRTGYGTSKGGDPSSAEQQQQPQSTGGFAPESAFAAMAAADRRGSLTLGNKSSADAAVVAAAAAAAAAADIKPSADGTDDDAFLTTLSSAEWDALFEDAPLPLHVRQRLLARAAALHAAGAEHKAAEIVRLKSLLLQREQDLQQALQRRLDLVKDKEGLLKSMQKLTSQLREAKNEVKAAQQSAADKRSALESTVSAVSATLVSKEQELAAAKRTAERARRELAMQTRALAESDEALRRAVATVRALEEQGALLGEEDQRALEAAHAQAQRHQAGARARAHGAGRRARVKGADELFDDGAVRAGRRRRRRRVGAGSGSDDSDDGSGDDSGDYTGSDDEGDDGDYAGGGRRAHRAAAATATALWAEKEASRFLLNQASTRAQLTRLAGAFAATLDPARENSVSASRLTATVAAALGPGAIAGDDAAAVATYLRASAPARADELGWEADKVDSEYPRLSSEAHAVLTPLAVPPPDSVDGNNHDAEEGLCFSSFAASALVIDDNERAEAEARALPLLGEAFAVLTGSKATDVASLSRSTGSKNGANADSAAAGDDDDASPSPRFASAAGLGLGASDERAAARRGVLSKTALARAYATLFPALPAPVLRETITRLWRSLHLYAHDFAAKLQQAPQQSGSAMGTAGARLDFNFFRSLFPTKLLLRLGDEGLVHLLRQHCVTATATSAAAPVAMSADPSGAGAIQASAPVTGAVRLPAEWRRCLASLAGTWCTKDVATVLSADDAARAAAGEDDAAHLPHKMTVNAVDIDGGENGADEAAADAPARGDDEGENSGNDTGVRKTLKIDEYVGDGGSGRGLVNPLAPPTPHGNRGSTSGGFPINAAVSASAGPLKEAAAAAVAETARAVSASLSPGNAALALACSDPASLTAALASAMRATAASPVQAALRSSSRSNGGGGGGAEQPAASGGRGGLGSALIELLQYPIGMKQVLIHLLWLPVHLNLVRGLTSSNHVRSALLATAADVGLRTHLTVPSADGAAPALVSDLPLTALPPALAPSALLSVADAPVLAGLPPQARVQFLTARLRERALAPLAAAAVGAIKALSLGLNAVAAHSHHSTDSSGSAVHGARCQAAGPAIVVLTVPDSGAAAAAVPSYAAPRDAATAAGTVVLSGRYPHVPGDSAHRGPAAVSSRLWTPWLRRVAAATGSLCASTTAPPSLTTAAAAAALGDPAAAAAAAAGGRNARGSGWEQPRGRLALLPGAGTGAIATAADRARAEATGGLPVGGDGALPDMGAALAHHAHHGHGHEADDTGADGGDGGFLAHPAGAAYAGAVPATALGGRLAVTAPTTQYLVKELAYREAESASWRDLYEQERRRASELQQQLELARSAWRVGVAPSHAAANALPYAHALAHGQLRTDRGGGDRGGDYGPSHYDDDGDDGSGQHMGGGWRPALRHASPPRSVLAPPIPLPVASMPSAVAVTAAGETTNSSQRAAAESARLRSTSATLRPRSLAAMAAAGDNGSYAPHHLMASAPPPQTVAADGDSLRTAQAVVAAKLAAMRRANASVSGGGVLAPPASVVPKNGYSFDMTVGNNSGAPRVPHAYPPVPVSTHLDGSAPPVPSAIRDLYSQSQLGTASIRPGPSNTFGLKVTGRGRPATANPASSRFGSNANRASDNAGFDDKADAADGEPVQRAAGGSAQQRDSAAAGGMSPREYYDIQRQQQQQRPRTAAVAGQQQQQQQQHAVSLELQGQAGVTKFVPAGAGSHGRNGSGPSAGAGHQQPSGGAGSGGAGSGVGTGVKRPVTAGARPSATQPVRLRAATSAGGAGGDCDGEDDQGGVGRVGAVYRGPEPETLYDFLVVKPNDAESSEEEDKEDKPSVDSKDEVYD